jgi:hypothetical protein
MPAFPESVNFLSVRYRIFTFRLIRLERFVIRLEKRIYGDLMTAFKNIAAIVRGGRGFDSRRQASYRERTRDIFTCFLPR